MELWLTVSEPPGNDLSLFFPMRNHTCMDLFWSSGQLDASIAWEVPCTGYGNSRLCICRGLCDPSRTSDGYALVPGIGASYAPRLGVVSR